MNLHEINPFLRFARIMEGSTHGTTLTYDCRLLYCISGILEVNCCGETMVLERGCFFTFQGGTPYSLYEKKKTRVIVIDFDYTNEYSNITHVMPPEKLDIWEHKKLHKTVHIANSTIFDGSLFLKDAFFAEADLTRICSEFDSHREFYGEICSGLLKSVLSEIARKIRTENKKTDIQDKLLLYLWSHRNCDISNYDVARHFGYNECYINRIMHACAQKTVRQYILTCRFEDASRKLLYTESSILQISEELGFSSASHFISFFKSRSGVTPSAYRRNSHKGQQ